MNWLKTYFFGVLSALGLLLLAIVGLNSWWKKQQRNKTLAATAQDLARRNIELEKIRASEKLSKTEKEAVTEVLEAAIRAEEHNRDDDTNLAEWLNKRTRSRDTNKPDRI